MEPYSSPDDVPSAEELEAMLSGDTSAISRTDPVLARETVLSVFHAAEAEAANQVVAVMRGKIAGPNARNIMDAAKVIIGFMDDPRRSGTDPVSGMIRDLSSRGKDR